MDMYIEVEIYHISIYSFAGRISQYRDRPACIRLPCSLSPPASLVLPCLQRDGHRVLLFSQMTSMLDLLEEYVSFRQWRYQRIDGGTKAMDRQARIDAFNGNGNNASQVRAKGWGEGSGGWGGLDWLWVWGVVSKLDVNMCVVCRASSSCCRRVRVGWASTSPPPTPSSSMT
jgi:hypothetical protein